MMIFMEVFCKNCQAILTGHMEARKVFVNPCRACLRKAEEIASANALQKISIQLGKGGDKLWEVTLPKHGF